MLQNVLWKLGRRTRTSSQQEELHWADEDVATSRTAQQAIETNMPVMIYVLVTVIEALSWHKAADQAGKQAELYNKKTKINEIIIFNIISDKKHTTKQTPKRLASSINALLWKKPEISKTPQTSSVGQCVANLIQRASCNTHKLPHPKFLWCKKTEFTNEQNVARNVILTHGGMSWSTELYPWKVSENLDFVKA